MDNIGNDEPSKVLEASLKIEEVVVEPHLIPKSEEPNLPQSSDPLVANLSVEFESALKNLSDSEKPESQPIISADPEQGALPPSGDFVSEEEKKENPLPGDDDLTQAKLPIPTSDLSDEEQVHLPLPPVLFREPSSSDPEAPESTHNYFQHLGSLRLQMSDWGPELLSTYIYSEDPLNQEGLNRINKEIKALTKALPCEPSGAVFLHMDSSNLSRLQVLISGTEDTPYEHGLYLFDVKLNPDYPNSPPQFTIKTTGNGTLRFNPNLYDSGYVCLSIINTWGGDPEEMWNPTYSTLMQVFLSIQALVMNNDVIQKEPGYEYLTTDSAVNIDYSGIVKYGNVSYAMLDMIQNPPVAFKEIVLKHFAMKKEKILEKVDTWVKESEKMGNGFDDHILSSHNPSSIQLMRQRGAQTVFAEKFEELKKALESLPSL